MIDNAVAKAAILWVIEHEGGLVEDPFDSGGLTKYGISHKSYPNLNIRDLTLVQAIEIYFEDYWLPSKSCWLIFPELAAKHIDTCVNMGLGGGGRVLQRAINFMTPMTTRTEEDGIVGEQTIMALKALGLEQGYKLDNFLFVYAATQLARYEKIINQNPTQIRFLNGWVKRARSVPFFDENGTFL